MRGSLLSPVSFTARLMLVAFLAAVLPITIAFIAMLQLPRDVATQSVRVTLQEATGRQVAELEQQRAELERVVLRLGGQQAFARAVASGDRAAIERQVTAASPGLRVALGDTEREHGPVATTVSSAAAGGSAQTITIWRDPRDTLLSERDTGVPLALARDGRLVARSSSFPADVPARVRREPRRGAFAHARFDAAGGDLRALARSAGGGSDLVVVAASTREIESRALRQPSAEIRRSMAFLVVATAIFAMAGAYVVNRAVRRFTRQTRRLARGEYDARLPVRGNDAFADLATSFNQLAAELQRRIADLERTANRYSRTLTAIDEGVCLWGDDGKIELWNLGAERLTGVAWAELEESPALVAALRAQLAPGVRRAALPPRRGAGRLVVDLVVTSVPGGGTLQVFRDITAAELLQQTRRDFMTTAAHELRTPLTTILGFSQTLVDPSVDLDEQQRLQFLQLIHEQALRLQRLTDAFFTNHQLANERVEVAIGTVSLRDAVNAGIAKAHAMPWDDSAPDGRGDVRVDVPADLCVQADERAITGVVALLVDNAWKYGRPPVSVVASRHGDSALVVVEDAGAGIPREHHERIFDPFYRVDVQMRAGIGGAGLGLFTARKLVHAMKGEIMVEALEGSGTRFTVELPLVGARGRSRDTAAS